MQRIKVYFWLQSHYLLVNWLVDYYMVMNIGFEFDIRCCARF